MENTPNELVSVIVPVYNSEAHLRETLASIFNQTYKGIEVIAVDDGSSDSSVDIIASFDGLVTLVQQQNSGPAAARNNGVSKAKGKWIAFLDADDIWEPEKLEKQLHTMSGCEWSYTDITFMGGVNDHKRDSTFSEKYSENILEKVICNNFISTSTVLIRRSVFIEIGGFDVTLRSIEDWDLWIRVSSKYAVAYVSDPLVRYRVHSTSVSRNARQTLPNHLRVICKTFSVGGVAEDIMHVKKLAMTSSLGICSQIAEEEKDFRFACQCAFRAFLQRPFDKNCAVRMVKTVTKLVLFWVGFYGR